ncbi:hypothetical protein L1987_83949 [Smallanthus sonchifolius]|uniref:Uncharacterized protein n=1 Tax=Smallanthus sonchifolius TaxID=185202 RepID=A0ACB8YDG3_9ASTR|nr:hypothetical protein L1987_83949 [Smallanthus sonchifolius]
MKEMFDGYTVYNFIYAILEDYTDCYGPDDSHMLAKCPRKYEESLRIEMDIEGNGHRCINYSSALKFLSFGLIYEVLSVPVGNGKCI